MSQDASHLDSKLENKRQKCMKKNEVVKFKNELVKFGEINDVKLILSAIIYIKDNYQDPKILINGRNENEKKLLDNTISK